MKLLALLLITTNAYAGDSHGHAFANIIIFLTIAILGYFIFGVKKLFEFIKNKKDVLKSPIFPMNNNILDVTFKSIQNRKLRVIDLIFSRKILYAAIIFYAIFIFALSNKGKNFWSEVYFFIFNPRTILLILFTYAYVLSQAYLINSSFSISKKYGRFQILFPSILFMLLLFKCLTDSKIFSESFLISIFLMSTIVIFFNLIQSSLIYIFKND
jgi:hypothetical protein